MKQHVAPTNEFFDLMADLAEDRLSPEQAARLEELLWNDEANRQHYIDFMLMVTGLHRTRSEGRAESGEWRVESREPAVQHSAFILPPTSALHDPRFTTHALLFSYVVATLIVGVGMLIGWAWKLPDQTEVARHASPPTMERQREPESKRPFVGRITGMIDCQWADPHTAVPGPVAVPLGRKYALSSGLMEITYDSGARVILQGPCTYEVESATSGFLSVGRLTARVEKNEERRAKNEELSDSRSSFLIPHSYFFVKTPTATVTDLGTEFGVEVDARGQTTSHVFRGSVEVRAAAANGETPIPARVLHENESAVVKVAGDVKSFGDRMIVSSLSAKPGDFIHKIGTTTIKTFDLVDVVAGGDGFSGRRNAGIDPSNGRTVPVIPEDPAIVDDGRYHRVEAMPFVDGVFVPDGGAGRVQIDSAGHGFEGFPRRIDGPAGHIWAGGVIPLQPPQGDLRVISTELGGIDYSSSDHGVLFMHADKGITFDLDAIRQANPGCKLLRFRAVAGNVEHDSAKGIVLRADLWVFVDGKVRFQRREINRSNGALPVVIPFAQNDRFLTLATTHGGDGISGDWTMFGDPRLEMVTDGTDAEPHNAKQEIPSKSGKGAQREDQLPKSQ